MKKKIIIILILCLTFGITTYVFDTLRIKKNKLPIFVIKTGVEKDGGTKNYIGFGYKVIKYHIRGENGTIVKDNYEIGSWFLKYNGDT